MQIMFLYGFILLLLVFHSVDAWNGRSRGSALPMHLTQPRMSSRQNSRRITMAHKSSVEDTTVVSIKSSNSVFEKGTRALQLLYKFCRPHTIKGTILASSMGVVRALLEYPGHFNVQLLPRALLGVIALLCGNAFIVGINQIYDVKIDEINKPFLPIASKSLSEGAAWVLVFACLITGISIVRTKFSPQIFQLYFLGLVLGTIYSVPPLQLKRVPILAGSIIATVRGFLLNFGVYYAVREALSVPFQWNPVVLFLSCFMTTFATVIAITKDLPDIEGDRQYQITTFASRFGVQTVANVAAALLSVAYLTAIALPFFFSKNVFRRLPMSLGHSLFLVYFLWQFRQLDSHNLESIKRFYKAIWTLFYLEYVLYPFI